MLKRLEIDNFILIDKMRLDFTGSFCCITGESGSGKSMILKAINALATGKMQRDWFFDASRNARVSVVISLDGPSGNSPELDFFLKENCIEPESGELVFERVFSVFKTSSFVQGSRKPSAVFNDLVSRLIMQNYQREESRMLEKGYALRYLDAFAGTTGECNELKGMRREYLSVKRKIDSICKELERSSEEKEYLEYAVSEIIEANIVPGEDEWIRAKLKSLRDREVMLAAARHADDVVSHGPSSAANAVRQALADFESIARKDDDAVAVCDCLESLSAQMEDASDAIRRYRERLETDDVSQTALLDRQDLLSRLKRKYGNGSLEGVLSFKEESERKLGLLKGDDASFAELRASAERLHKEIIAKQNSLDHRREESKAKAEKKVESILTDLSMPDVRFEISLARSSDDGKDSSASFSVAVNKGKEKGPIGDVASGGELSRIFLALLCTANETGSECEIFDEIDAGLGGESASALSDYLKGLSQKRQIIAVTHQAMIAAKADCNIRVEKISDGDKTLVRAAVLDKEQKRIELRRMIAGRASSDAGPGLEELLGTIW